MCENTFVYYALLYLTEKHAVHFKYIKYNLRMYIYWYILTKKKKKNSSIFLTVSTEPALYASDKLLSQQAQWELWAGWNSG